MLGELRDQYESQMKQNKEDFTAKYEGKVSVLQSLLSKERSKNQTNNGNKLTQFADPIVKPNCSR